MRLNAFAAKNQPLRHQDAKLNKENIQLGQSTKIQGTKHTTTMKKTFIIFFYSFLLSIIFQSCMEKKSTDPKKVYTLWAYQKPDKNIEVLNGQYWKSAHWTNEYIVYLQIQTSQTWWNAFTKKNNLLKDTIQWQLPSTAPTWFTPSEKSESYRNPDNTESLYLYNPETEETFIYENQL